jgi:carbonic anhydrase
MDFFETMLERNTRFAETEFAPELKILPSTGTIVLGCVDPRVDPTIVLGLKQGEVAVIRNVGGRVNKPLMETLAILRVVAKAAGREGGGRNLVLLHHTDCGIIGCYHHAPELLAQFFGVDVAELDEAEITDPYKSVVRDISTLKANTQMPDGVVVSGLVYDVKTGRVETVVPPAPLRQGR